MIDALLRFLPSFLPKPSEWVTAASAVIGVVSWLVGGRFSRSILTLGMVAVGAYVGMRMPRWFGWAIDGAAVGVFGALLLGSIAYFFHRTGIGLSLAAVSAIWAGSAVWIALGRPFEWNWPGLQWTGDVTALVAQLWQGFPPELRQNLPAAICCGLAGGLLTATLWPKLGRALLFSLLGLTILLVVTLPGIAAHRPHWLTHVPPYPGPQALVLLGLFLMGTVLQLLLMRSEGKTAPVTREKELSDNPTAVPAGVEDRQTPSLGQTPTAPSDSPATTLPAAPPRRPVPLTSQRQPADDRSKTSPPAESSDSE